MDPFIKQTLFLTWHPLRWMALILGLTFAMLALLTVKINPSQK